MYIHRLKCMIHLVEFRNYVCINPNTIVNRLLSYSRLNVIMRTMEGWRHIVCRAIHASFRLVVPQSTLKPTPPSNVMK